MTRHERRLLIDCVGIGVATTLLVIAADAAGLLAPLENWLYDSRVRACQLFTPPPTDRLVHLDIDDRALEVIGRWPWPRARWAEILDEIRLAQPTAVEMDLLLTEPQALEYRQRPGGDLEIIDNDAALAEAIEKLGNVTLPLSLMPEPAATPAHAAMVQMLRADPEMQEAELLAGLRSRGLPARKAQVAGSLYQARRDAVFQRVRDEVVAGIDDADALRRKILRRIDPEFHSPIGRLIEEQLERVLAVRQFERFSFPLPAGGEQMPPMRVKGVPVRGLSESAVAGAFVDYFRLGGATIRSVPLLLRHGDRVYAQMGLRLACQLRGADLSRAQFVNGRELRVPQEDGGDLRIPLMPPQTTTDGVRVMTLFNVPWLGTHDWQTMYDWPKHEQIARHLSLNVVWQACLMKQHITRNIAEIDESMLSMYELLDPPKMARYETQRPRDLQARASLIDEAMHDAQEWLAQYETLKPEEIDERGARFLAAAKALPGLKQQTFELERDLRRQREEISQALKDKAVLIGWIATAAVADFVPTSLHDKCPGVVVHGAIFNGIMTGEMWRAAPWWIGAVITGALGLLTAFTTARFPPLPALGLAFAAACLFAIVNGVLLFDYFNLILPAAAALVTIPLVWGVCTMTRVIIEAAERRRITARFRSYNDPKLVSFVLENPDKVRFDGERREMTVVFTDIAGFTALSEKLGEKIVGLLNELLGELVPIIRDHHQGYVNKFLGDGIMFFYNAPREQPHHAADAVATVLDMHAAVERFNERLRERGLPPIFIRAGISTGEMVVGDAGGAGTTDYTVLGDVVNLGSRLEAANKAVGTRTLITARTAELLDSQFVLRPVGRLRVVGKDEAVMTFEPIARAADAKDEMRSVACLFTQLIEKYTARQFDDALSIAADIDRLIGPSKLVQLYRDLAERHLRHPPGDDFDGSIVLTEK